MEFCTKVQRSDIGSACCVFICCEGDEGCTFSAPPVSPVQEGGGGAGWPSNGRQLEVLCWFWFDRVGAVRAA